MHLIYYKIDNLHHQKWLTKCMLGSKIAYVTCDRFDLIKHYRAVYRKAA